jgi:tetratricopeptide (TPR) repeat protein
MAADETTPGTSSRDTWLALLLLTLLIVAYSPALNGSYLWDDDAHVTRTALRSWDGLRQIWFHLGATQQYYPLLHSAFWLEASLWGDQVLGYHLANVLLHFSASVLVVVLCQRLEIKGAWLAGFIFALHPVQVESVAWISEQKNTLSLVLYLLSAIAYLKFDQRRRPRDYWVAFALFICALLTKTVTATLPATLLVIFWWGRGRIDWRRDVWPLVPWFVVAAAGGLFTAWVEHNIIGAEGAEFSLDFVQRLLLAGRVVCFYIMKLVWPRELIFSYPRWSVSATDARQYLFTGALLALTALLWMLRKQSRGALASLLIFTGSLFPVLGFFNVYPFRYSYVADHFQYLASIALIVPAATGLVWLVEQTHTLFARRAAQGAIATVLAAYAAQSWHISHNYTDAKTSYRAVLAKNPDSWMAHNNLGRILMRGTLGMPEAIPHFEAVLRLKPDHARAHYSLGLCEYMTGRPLDAVPHFERVLVLEPHNALLVTNSHYFLGEILRSVPGREAEAAAHAKEAERLKQPGVVP